MDFVSSNGNVRGQRELMANIELMANMVLQGNVRNSQVWEELNLKCTVQVLSQTPGSGEFWTIQGVCLYGEGVGLFKAG